MLTYVAVIHKDGDSDFEVRFPDLPGCVSSGSTIEEAKAKAREALELHLAGLLDDGDALPMPTKAAQVMADPENLGALAFAVTVSV